MKKIRICGAIVSVLGLSGVASASGLVVQTTGPVTVTPIVMAGTPEGTVTYQIFAELGASDLLLGVSAGAAGMVFGADSAIINDTASPFFGLVAADLPTGAPFGAAWDTYVSIGDTTFPTDSQLSPGFLGGDGTKSVIHGSRFREPIDGDGWFDSNPGTFDGLGGGLIFNLTLPSTACWYWQAELGYSLGETGELAAAFVSVGCIPTPGSIALLCLAGVGIGRRRRVDAR